MPKKISQMKNCKEVFVGIYLIALIGFSLSSFNLIIIYLMSVNYGIFRLKIFIIQPTLNDQSIYFDTLNVVFGRKFSIP